MILNSWYEKRGSRYILQRGVNLVSRYGLTPHKAEQRIEYCLERLAEDGCKPTLMAPGLVVERHPDFILRLAEAGAEIAVHGYNHVDLRSYPVDSAAQQLLHAAQVFKNLGLPFSGFRCPYLSWSDELINHMPAGVFKYSSNQAIYWQICTSSDSLKPLMIDTLDRFYAPLDSAVTLCTPNMTNELVEIPVCVPDDLQLFDGYQLNAEQAAENWKLILETVYQRGELFTLMFHPELFWACLAPLHETLQAASSRQPPIWIARLDQIAEWWLEKAANSVSIQDEHHQVNIQFHCSPRTGILIREPGTPYQADGELAPWDGCYYRFLGKQLIFPPSPRPFVGLDRAAPGLVMSCLAEQGYILDTSPSAQLCTVYLSREDLESCTSYLTLINEIEKSKGPLLRFNRWPEEYKCALSISGDLDALSLFDYSARIFHRSDHRELVRSYQWTTQKLTLKGSGDSQTISLCQIENISRLSKPLSIFDKIFQSRYRLVRILRRRFRYARNLIRERLNHADSDVNPLVAGIAASFSPGKMVRVKSRSEIQATLDRWNRLGGCSFMEEMWDYCGTIQRVYKNVNQFFDERDYHIKHCKKILLLDDVQCQGTKDFGPCDRSCYFFWREEWLEKLDEKDWSNRNEYDHRH